MSRSQASLFVNCNRCQLEVEVFIEESLTTDFASQADEELLARGWLVTIDEDICLECLSEEDEEDEEEDDDDDYDDDEDDPDDGPLRSP